MTNNIQETTITEDDEPFFIQQRLVDKTLESVRAQLDKVSLVTTCIDCGEDIGAARKAAVPSAVRCIDCETLLQEQKQRNARR
jgi:RNA polymerase-binding transcription factor DksA